MHLDCREVYNSTLIVCNTEKYNCAALGVLLSTSEKLIQLLVALKPELTEGSWGYCSPDQG